MIVIIGIAGSGKTVQAKLLADRLGYRWISTGEFLRKHISPAKQQAMVSGQLIEDEEVISILGNFFKGLDKSQESVLDGFPRTQRQADWLIEQHKNRAIKLSAVIHLIIDNQTAKERLVTRARPDDNDEAIAQRFSEFEKATRLILDSFKKARITVRDIDGGQTVDDTHEAIKKALVPK